MDIDRLPKKVQEYIRDLTRERDSAVRLLNEYLDEQTPSAFSYTDFTHLGSDGGDWTTKYVQTHVMEIRHEGVLLRIILRDDNIDLQWMDSDEHHKDVAFIPASYCSARLVSKENMR